MCQKLASTLAHECPLRLLPCWRSKYFLIHYQRGLRVVIFTANAIYPDCNNKSQGELGGPRLQRLSSCSSAGAESSCPPVCCAGLFWQDFPPKDEHSPQVRGWPRPGQASPSQAA